MVPLRLTDRPHQTSAVELLVELQPIRCRTARPPTIARPRTRSRPRPDLTAAVLRTAELRPNRGWNVWLIRFWATVRPGLRTERLLLCAVGQAGQTANGYDPNAQQNGYTQPNAYTQQNAYAQQGYGQPNYISEPGACSTISRTASRCLRDTCPRRSWPALGIFWASGHPFISATPPRRCATADGGRMDHPHRPVVPASGALSKAF